ncbi:Sensory box histidine kinase/response regulator [hydrothermal vent metagenome]|uniref:Sensory box histidine kinase/response regulator n=1 Tax=hydrothermal vent metagenome TaxID=652676 RepID=A0A1W1BD33_9ZZZZ
MSEKETIFDINEILQTSFKKLENLSKMKNVELIFEMHSTIPRKLKGDSKALERLLHLVLTFVFENTQKNEIVLVLNAPEDFLYEELLSFKISNSGITKEKVLAFLETELGNNLTLLNGEILYDEHDIHLRMPFTISELGLRRHYRLPSKDMLQKKVLLIVESENVTRCISKMFKYFPYDVDFGFKEFQEGKSVLEAYDVVIIEDNLISSNFTTMVEKIQEKKSFKYVRLGDEDTLDGCTYSCDCLVKPVTQESIFELIVSLFGSCDKHPKSRIARRKLPTISSPVILSSEEKSSLENLIEKKRSKQVAILDLRAGMKNAEERGVNYTTELKMFLETFDKSDLYFRQIVNERATQKIKEFCIDLEKQSKIIGAESMQKFANVVSLIFVYDKLDMLPIYPGRYHIELDKLIVAINRELYV